METLPISKGLTLSFGLSWEQHDPYSGSEHNQIMRWKTDGYAHAARYKHLGGRVYGLLRATPTAMPDKGLIAGAGVIATHPKLQGKTGLVLLPIEDAARGKLVICVGLRVGVVVLDRLVLPDQVSDVRNDFLKDHTPGDTLETWGDTSTSQITHAFTFDDLTPARRTGGQAVALETLSSSRWPLIAGGAVTAMIVLAGGLELWLTLAEEGAKRRAMLELSSKTPVAMYTAEIAKWLARPISPVPESLELAWNSFKDFPTDHAGWTLERITCAPTPSVACAVQWHRREGTLAEFRQLAPPDWHSIIPVGQDGIAMSIDLALPEGKLDLSGWPPVNTYRDSLLSHWQFLAPGGWQATVGAPAQQAVPVSFNADQLQGIATMPDAPLGMVVTVKEMAWDFAEPTDPDSPVSRARLGRAMELTSPLEIVFNGKTVTFSFTGTAYVHK